MAGWAAVRRFAPSLEMKWLVVIALFALGWSGSANADFEAALAAQGAGDYQEAA
jgi:hypothetical protein